MMIESVAHWIHDSPKVMQLVSGRSGAHTQFSWSRLRDSTRRCLLYIPAKLYRIGKGIQAVLQLLSRFSGTGEGIKLGSSLALRGGSVGAGQVEGSRDSL